MPLQTVELETAPNPRHAVIWLHGLGADGNDFKPLVPELVALGLVIGFARAEPAAAGALRQRRHERRQERLRARSAVNAGVRPRRTS